MRGVGRICALGREWLFPQPQQVASFYCSRPFRPFFQPWFKLIPSRVTSCTCLGCVCSGDTTWVQPPVFRCYHQIRFSSAHKSEPTISLSLTCCCGKSLENNMCCNNFSIVSLPSTIVPLNQSYLWSRSEGCSCYGKKKKRKLKYNIFPLLILLFLLFFSGS